MRAIIALVVCALAGLVFLQYRLLMNSVALKEQTFKRNVIAAMNAAIEKLEEIDARNAIFLMEDAEQTHQGRNNPADSLFEYSFVSRQSPGVTTRMKNGKFQVKVDRPQRVAIRAFNILGSVDTTIVDTLRSRGVRDVTLPKDRLTKGVFFVQVHTDSATTTTRIDPGKQTVSVVVNDNDIRKGKVVKRIADSFSALRISPASKRYSKELVDSILTYSLASHDVSLSYEFGITTDDSLSLARTQIPQAELTKSEYSVPVIPLAPVPTNETLFLHFPGYRSYIMGALLPELGSSFVLLCVIIFCFVYTIRTILKQKEFAGRLTDFINNMTHEFKTPISTIALASEAMTQTEVRNSKTKVGRYTQVITDENRRMRTQVDKILQMAALEEGETEFNKSPVEMHQIIVRAVANIELQVTARNGSIKTQLDASRSWVTADPVHIENVIHNLLDNAVKYSDGNPTIAVTTSNLGNLLIVSISDRGIGIPKESIDKVFDKYYRVPTGNVHDVKGFGLGLSYVKLIVEAHQGAVSITRNPDKGTTVELSFPAVSGR